MQHLDEIITFFSRLNSYHEISIKKSGLLDFHHFKPETLRSLRSERCRRIYNHSPDFRSFQRYKLVLQLNYFTVRVSLNLQQESLLLRNTLSGGILPLFRVPAFPDRSCLLYTSPSPRDGLLS